MSVNENIGYASRPAEALPSCAQDHRAVFNRLCVILIALALSVMCLPGCVGSSPEDVITRSLSSQLDKVKNLDGDFVSSVASYMDADRFNDYGIESAAFVRAYFEGFDYTIDTIDVDEPYGHAIATLTCKSYSDFRDRLGEASDELVDDAADYASMSREDISRVYGEMLMKTLAEVDLAPTKQVDFYYYLDDDTWSLNDSFESTVASALLTN